MTERKICNNCTHQKSVGVSITCQRCFNKSLWRAMSKTMKEELYNKIDKFCNETDWSKYPTYEHALEGFIKGIVAEETKELNKKLSQAEADYDKMFWQKNEIISNLQAQIEKMKCGGNCKFEYWKNTGGCYDQKCRFTGLDCTNCKDKWKGKWEND